MDQATVDGSGTVVVSHDRAVALIDELRRQERLLGAVQARRAALMVEFGDVRRGLDQRVIGDRAAEGGSPRYRAGEFAVTEISLAVTASKFGISRVVGMARRLRAEAPDVWDSWCAGEIDHDKAVRINRALRRLVRDDSKQLLNSLVVAVAPLKTPELLGRWLNQFIAQVEPDETDERLRRAFEDRYVSVRPDIDGISFLHAALSCVDAAAIDQLLSALAGVAGPGDDRTFAQRRADALVDVLCGRISNGCRGTSTDAGFDVNTDTDDHLDDPAGPGCDPDPNDPVELADDWDDRDFDQPSSTFRRTDHDCDTSNSGLEDTGGTDELTPGSDNGQGPAHQEPIDNGPFDDDQQNTRSAPLAGGRVGKEPGSGPACTCEHKPLPVTIGIVVTASALFGYTNTPGQLADRSSLIPAHIIRDLAAQPGTLFHRLITDEAGNLLEVTELGRFPSRKLGFAVRYRDPVCVTPTCHTAAQRCDIDHLTPVPEGQTAGANLGPECRGEHRAKTHGGHRISRTGEHGIEWTTPTGHTYASEDPPLPVDSWPAATSVEVSASSPVENAAAADRTPRRRKPTKKRQRRRD